MMNTSHNVQLMPPNTEWTDDQWTTFRSWIVSHLQTGPVTVTFNKKDGSERVMTCSLQPELLPPALVKESKTHRPSSPTVLSVYDLEANAWRSFTVKNVTNVTLKLS